MTTTNKQQGGELPQDELLNLLIESQSYIGGDWRERRDKAVESAQRAASVHDAEMQAAIGIRLRRVAEAAGVEVEGDNAFYYGCAFSILGNIAGALERAASVPAQSVVSGEAVAFDEAYALELAHDCGVRFKGDIPNRAMEDALIKFAQKVLFHFTVPAAAPVQGDKVYQIASDGAPSGWSDYTKHDYDAHTNTRWRKKRVLYTAPPLQPNSGRDAALEEAAQACELQASEPECPERAQYCADAIRALAAHPANGAQAGAAPQKKEG